MRTTKTFTSVNYLDHCGDTYARWSQTNKPKDAVLLVVTDETGKRLYSDVVRKNAGGLCNSTLAACKRTLITRLRLKTEAAVG